MHTDQLAAPRSASNEEGEVVWSWERDAFGAAKADRGPDRGGVKTKLRLRFPGQYYDDESALHYNHHRDYDPKLGRYIQSDPIGLWGGDNRYGYVGGNPVNWIDPEGLATLKCTESYQPGPDGKPIPGSTISHGCEIIGGATAGSDVAHLGSLLARDSLHDGFSSGETLVANAGDLLTCDGSLRGKTNKTATALADNLRRRGADGNEHGYLIAMGSGGRLVSIGPFTSGRAGAINANDIFSAASSNRTNTLIIGAIHNHPPAVIPNPRMDFANRLASGDDVRVDNELAQAGYNVSPTFYHYIVTPAGQLTVYGMDQVIGQKIQVF